MAETAVKYAQARAPEPAPRSLDLPITAGAPAVARGSHAVLCAHQRDYAPAAELLAAKKLGQRPAVPRIDVGDVQGLVLRGYGSLPYCRYVLLQVRDPQQGRAWLRQLNPRIARGAPAADDVAVQVAFTHAGLAALGLPEDTLQAFSREFIAGISGSHRSRFLGDTGDSAPEKWHWGCPKKS
jgi:hypothetical protein